MNNTTVNALKIVSISEPIEKNGSTYRKIGLKPVSSVGGLLVQSVRKPHIRLCFGSSKDKQGNIIPSDQIFTQIQEGSIKEGDCVFGEEFKFNTTKYVIKNGNKETEANSYSGVFFSHENSLKVANRALRLNKACVLLEGGELSAPENLEEQPATGN